MDGAFLPSIAVHIVYHWYKWCQYAIQIFFQIATETRFKWKKMRYNAIYFQCVYCVVVRTHAPVQGCLCTMCHSLKSLGTSNRCRLHWKSYFQLNKQLASPLAVWSDLSCFFVLLSDAWHLWVWLTQCREYLGHTHTIEMSGPYRKWAVIVLELEIYANISGWLSFRFIVSIFRLFAINLSKCLHFHKTHSPPNEKRRWWEYGTASIWLNCRLV